MVPTSDEMSEIQSLSSYEAILLYCASKLTDFGVSGSVYPGLEVDASGTRAPALSLKAGVVEYGPNQGLPLAWGSFVLPVSKVHSSNLWSKSQEIFTDSIVNPSASGGGSTGN